MKSSYLLLLIVFFSFTENAGAVECENGWSTYKDELCMKVFPTLLTYNEASDFCSEQGTEMSKSSLVMVKELDIQELLVNYTGDIYDNMWLGGRFDEGAAEFKWEDGTLMTYTNWQEGSPRNDSDSNICIEMRPINAKITEGTQGKWLDVNCNKRNLVICQKVLSWTLQDATNEIIKIRKQLLEATDERNDLLQRLETTEQNLELTQENLITTQQHLDNVTSRVVPVGSIYIEYFNQPSPPSLWPDLAWQDVTSYYAGLFFRASGGNAASWGVRQTGCAPRLTQASFGYTSNLNGYASLIDVPESGQSQYLNVGSWDNPQGTTRYLEGLRFIIAGCEVRPANQAIRIWKRTA